MNRLLKLRGLESEAELFATNHGYRAVSDAVGQTTVLARVALATEHQPNNREETTRVFEIVYKLLYHAASALAEDVRDHLGLDEIGREWRIYDREYQELQNELAEWKSKGDDLSGGAWAGPSPSGARATDGTATEIS